MIRTGEEIPELEVEAVPRHRPVDLDPGGLELELTTYDPPGRR